MNSSNVIGENKFVGSLLRLLIKLDIEYALTLNTNSTDDNKKFIEDILPIIKQLGEIPDLNLSLKTYIHNFNIIKEFKDQIKSLKLVINSLTEG